MIHNALGTALLNGSTTKATFAGLPLVGCCNDYTVIGLVDAFFAFATSLNRGQGVPAIVIDVVHDVTPAALVTALRAYSKWFVPGLPGKPFLQYAYSGESDRGFRSKVTACSGPK